MAIILYCVTFDLFSSFQKPMFKDHLVFYFCDIYCIIFTISVLVKEHLYGSFTDCLTGNSWGDVPGCKGMGCGNQEEFFGCADIKIIHETQPESPSPSTTTPTTTTTIPTTTLTTTTTPTTTTTTTPTPAPTTTTMTATATPSSQPPRQTAIPTKSPAVPTTVPAGREKCRFYPVGVWRLVQGMTFWCNAICSHVGPNVYCPWSHCAWACL